METSRRFVVRDPSDCLKQVASGSLTRLQIPQRLIPQRVVVARVAVVPQEMQDAGLHQARPQRHVAPTERLLSCAISTPERKRESPT
jgi:hypothetical protein